MSIGISTSCFYPLETENSLKKIGEMDIHTSEIFFNAYCEIQKPILDDLKQISKEYCIDIKSIHPFSSCAEPFFLFSNYKRRFYDTLEYYKKYLDAANELGAKFLIIHGSKLPLKIHENDYFERFSIMHEEGKKQGIIVAQENVFNHSSQDPVFLNKMKNFMGNDFNMVLDIKQIHRAKYVLDDFVPCFAENIVHIHISDNCTKETCLLPGTGTFDFSKLFKIMKLNNYCGSYIIELYRENFKEREELKTSYNYLDNLLNNC